MTVAKVVEMTPELKEKMERACHECVDVLGRHCANPFEAMICLQYLRETLEEMIGCTMKTVIVADEDTKNDNSSN